MTNVLSVRLETIVETAPSAIEKDEWVETLVSLHLERECADAHVSERLYSRKFAHDQPGGSGRARLSANSNLRASVAAAWGVDPFERVVDFLVGQRRPTDRVV